MASQNHHSLCHLLENRMQFLVTESVLGGIESDVILPARGPYAARIMVKTVLDVARGLLYMHSLGIVHGEMKPAKNLLIAVPGTGTPLREVTVKRIDFCQPKPF